MTTASRRFYLVLMTSVFVICGLAKPALSQTMSYSEYTDISASSDGSTLYATLNGYDNSTGCSHGGYTTDMSFDGGGNSTYVHVDGMSVNLSLPFNGEGDYQENDWVNAYCDCVGGAFTLGGGGKQWYLSHKDTYYKDPEGSDIACWYRSTACASGAPTCVNGVGIGTTFGCSYYAHGAWLVAQTYGVGTTKCLFALVDGVSFPGVCN
jgi:hypothetical protein